MGSGLPPTLVLALATCTCVYLSTIRGASAAACGSGQFVYRGRCDSCESFVRGCAQCVRASDCAVCQPGWTRYDGGGSCEGYTCFKCREMPSPLPAIRTSPSPAAPSIAPMSSLLFPKDAATAIAATNQYAAANDATLRAAWAVWKSTFDSPSNDGAAFAMFVHNVKRVAQLNSQKVKATSKTWYAVGAFSAKSVQEFKSSIYMKPQKVKTTKRMLQAAVALPSRTLLASLPTAVDWRTVGKVTPVKNQQSCGSCWAFAAAGAIESKLLIQVNRAYDAANASDVAPAQLVGCVTPTNGYSRSQSCAGGFPVDAFDYAKRGTLVLNTLYPYAQSPKDDPNMAKCQKYYIDKAFTYEKVTVTGYSQVTPFSATALMAAVAQQPVTIALDAGDKNYAIAPFDSAEWRQDESDIWNGEGCRPGVITHAMLVVGYSTGPTGAYWIVKNSWDRTWGSSGYIKIRMMPDGTPGICNMYADSWYPTGVRYTGNIADSFRGGK